MWLKLENFGLNCFCRLNFVDKKKIFTDKKERFFCKKKDFKQVKLKNFACKKKKDL